MHTIMTHCRSVCYIFGQDDYATIKQIHREIKPLVKKQVRRLIKRVIIVRFFPFFNSSGSNDIVTWLYNINV